MKPTKFFPFLIAYYEMVTYLSNDMYLPALPKMALDLSSSNELVQLSLTTWFLGSASIQLFLGPISDRFGRRPVLLIGCVIFILATILCAATPNITTLLIARFFQGCAVCSVTVAGYAAVHEMYDQNEAMKVFAVMSSITILAPAFGPMIGSVVLKFGGNWQDIFWILAILAFISLVLLYKWMPESLPIHKRHPIKFIHIGRNYKSIIINPRFMLNILSFGSFFAALIAWITMGPFLVIEAFHYTPFMFGVFQVMIFGSFIVGSRFVKTGVKNIGVKKLIHISLFICVASALLSVIFSMIFPNEFIYFIITFMFFAFGVALSFSPLQRLAIEASAAPMGARTAILSSMTSLFAMMGSLVATYFYFGATYSLALIILAAGVFSILSQLFSREKHV